MVKDREGGREREVIEGWGKEGREGGKKKEVEYGCRGEVVWVIMGREGGYDGARVKKNRGRN